MKKVLFLATAAAVVLSSCTKDATEVVGLDKNAATISASFESDQTRTYLGPLGENGKRPVVWSKGDALGVFSENDADMNTVFSLVAGEDTTEGSFSGSAALFGGVSETTPVDFYAYYPYAYGAKVNGTILSGLQVPAVQLYNTVEEDGSFSANTSPAVAVMKDVTSADKLNLSLKATTYNLVFPIRGMGNVEKLELTIADVKLAGAGTVDLAAANPVLTLDGSATDMITLKMGTNTEVNALDFAGVKNVVFVVPANIDIYNKVIKLHAILKDGQGTSTQTVKIINMPTEHADNYKALPRGEYANIYANMDYTELIKGVKKPWTFGVDGEWVIDNEADFITYAYFTQMYQKHLYDPANYPYMPKDADYLTLLDNGYELDANGIIVNKNGLDFADWNTTKAQAERDALILRREKLEESTLDEASEQEIEMLNVKINALEWYFKNGGAINSLGYNGLKGYGEKGAPVAIKNLTVKGNGLINGASLENLKLVDLKVVADEDATYAGLVSAINATAWDTNPYQQIENVTVDGGQVITSATTIAGGLFGIVNLNYDVVAVEELPTVEGATNYGQVYGSVAVSTGDVETIDLDALKVTDLSHVAIYKVEGDAVNTTLYVTSANATTADYAGVVTSVEKCSFFANDVAYWNGDSTTAADADGTTTSAEEFAYSVANDANVTLTNDINLQGKPWVVKSSNANFTVISDEDTSVTPHKQNTWTISEVNIKDEAAEAGKYYSVFGAKADIDYVNVKDVTINLTAGAGNPNLYVSGLVLQGTVENVAVEDINITVNKAWNTVTNTITSAPTFAYKAGGLNAIGGVIAGGSYNCVKNVSVKNVNILGDAYLNTTTENINGTDLITNIGAIAGVLSYDAGKNKTTFTNLDVKDATVSVSKPMTNAKAKKSESYAKECVYSFNNTAVGVIWMYAADFTPGVNATHYLVANGCETSGDRFTAGILAHKFVNWDSVANNNDVEISENEITDYAYMIYAPTVNNSTKAYIGFKSTK